ncbi:hypothetical protein V5799_009899 [Amblyomma americanum]|uniref:Uncharacterized protein n=1 Tax=Amblyomma americanum TaxID=6943 RepID=A0AAQ4F9K7_AMBAM
MTSARLTTAQLPTGEGNLPASSSSPGDDVSTPPASPRLDDLHHHQEEEHRVLRGKLDQIRATLRERRRARRRATPYPTPGATSPPGATSDEPVLV